MPSERVQRQMNRLLTDARRALRASKWARAAEIAETLLALDPGNAEATALLKLAEGKRAPDTPLDQPQEVATRSRRFATRAPLDPLFLLPTLPAEDGVRIPEFTQAARLSAVSSLATILRGLGTSLVGLSNLLQTPVLFSFASDLSDANRAADLAENLVRGLEELQVVKRNLIAAIDTAKKEGTKARIPFADLLPGFIRSEIRRLLGQAFLDRLLNLKPLEIDPDSCEATSSGNTDEAFQLDLTALYAELGGFGAALKAVLGEKIDVTFRATITAKIECDKLRQCILSITDITGIELGGFFLPDLDTILIDTKEGTAEVGLTIGPNITVLELPSLIEELEDLIATLTNALGETTDPDQKRRLQRDIDELQDRVDDLKERQEHLGGFTPG